MKINQIWSSNDQNIWEAMLDQYWYYVKDENKPIEREMEKLDAFKVKKLQTEEWVSFLRKYFQWKFTNERNYVANLKHFEHMSEENLYKVKEQIFSFDKSDIKAGLSIKISGLSIAGISGLLSLLFPESFGTVDKYVVLALYSLDEYRVLPEFERMKAKVEKANYSGLTLREGIRLIEIMRTKAHELNAKFQTKEWTPRKIDKILWSMR